MTPSSGAHVAAISLDSEGRIRSWNPAAERLCGCSASAAIGAAFGEIFVPESPASERDALEQARAQGSFDEEGWRSCPGGGRLLAGIATVVQHDADRRVIGYAKIIRDLGKLRADEESDRAERLIDTVPILKATFNQAAVGLALLSPNLEWVTYNKRLCELLGVEDDQLPARKFADFIHPDDRARFDLDGAAVASGERVSAEGRVHLVRLDGRSIRVLLTRSAVREGEGGPVRFVLNVLQDMTQLDQAERAAEELFQLSQRDLESLRHERREKQSLVQRAGVREKFVVTLSHDLRTPLTAASLGADLLAREATPAPQRTELARKVKENLARIGRMISDLLDANRIQSGRRFPIRVGAYELRSLVGDTIDALPASLRRRVVLVAPEPVEGYWCYDGIRRVVENLVSNAVKYGAEERPVTITLRKEGARVEIAVHNEGKGLSAEEISHIFDPFHRTESADSGVQKGWGLGLTLVRGISEAHGGSVRAESEPGLGTTFFVSLPIDARPLQKAG